MTCHGLRDRAVSSGVLAWVHGLPSDERQAWVDAWHATDATGREAMEHAALRALVDNAEVSP